MTDRFDDGLRTVLAIAEALREEFGVGIDAHPGGERTEVGSVNRAFRVAARVIVGEVIPEGRDPTTILTNVLRQAALRWLAELGVRLEDAEVLLGTEVG